MNLLRVGACSEVADGESTGNETPMGSSSRPRTAACVPAGPQRPILFHNRGTAVGPAVGPVAMREGRVRNPAKKQNLPSSRKRVLSHIKHDEAGWKIGGSDSAQVPQPDLSELGKLSISFGHFAPGCLPRPSCALLLLLLSHLMLLPGATDSDDRDRMHWQPAIK